MMNDLRDLEIVVEATGIDGILSDTMKIKFEPQYAAAMVNLSRFRCCSQESSFGGCWERQLMFHKEVGDGPALSVDFNR